jgi:hypothetical protein
MRRRLFSVLVLIAACSRADAGCIDPATLTHSSVSVTRYFDEQEKQAQPGLLGISGTGWFLSATSLVTAEHVAASMNLTDRGWKLVEIGNAEGTRSIPARIQRLAGSREKLVVLELQSAFSNAQRLELRMEPLAAEEPVVSPAYPDGRLRVAGGRFVQFGDGEKLAGMALLEMYDGNDRLVLDYGASGAPVLDCNGRVVAVVTNVFTTTLQFLSRAVRISTAWGSPNVVSVPVAVLENSPRAE